MKKKCYECQKYLPKIIKYYIKIIIQGYLCGVSIKRFVEIIHEYYVFQNADCERKKIYAEQKLP